MSSTLARARLSLGCLLLASSVACADAAPSGTAVSTGNEVLPLDLFFPLFHPETAVYASAANAIFSEWDVANAPLVLEAMRFSPHADDLLARLEKVTGESFGGDFHRAFRWLWNQPIEPHPEYARWKSKLYGEIDPRFSVHFDRVGDARIRLDEILWGGVARDGIPPLEYPDLVAADAAGYLGSSDVVFGLFIDGEARAYPKRILAWHELVRDRIGEVEITGVYCTLCGAMIAYESEIDGRRFRLGTSGFLYRSNKLMYDHETESLWSTLTGEPVLGALAGTSLRLVPRPTVTTTWGAWKDAHPQTKVLSIDTGHIRDYSEGAAYREYFATDELMFATPRLDSRLRNKDEVLVLRFGRPGTAPAAIDRATLPPHSIYGGTHGGVDYTVFTDRSGAHRIYAVGGFDDATYDGGRRARDATGRSWSLSEQTLTGTDGTAHERLPAHRAFWFGWFAAYPGTELIRADE